MGVLVNFLDLQPLSYILFTAVYSSLVFGNIDMITPLLYEAQCGIRESYKTREGEEWEIKSLMEEKPFELGLECQIEFWQGTKEHNTQRPTSIFQEQRTQFAWNICEKEQQWDKVVEAREWAIMKAMQVWVS